MNQSVLASVPLKHAYLFARGEKLQGRYLIVRQLGAGGMGAVYEAVDERLQVTVAIKETFAVDARLRQQFEQEARLLAQLSHPALPRVSDYFTEDGRAFLVMQFIGGEDLAHIIAQQPGPFPRAQVIAWADQLLDALIYLHTQKRQIVHRDIKPHNLKLTANGQIALLDFGLAKAHAIDQTTSLSSHSIFGYTRRYSPLEQIQDQGTSPQSDIYALGATLYQLLTGIKPPDALARAAALANSKADPLVPAHEVHPVIERELSAVIQKALALNSNNRFQTAKDFREALRVIGRSEPERAGGLPASAAATRLNSAVDPFDSYSILKPDEMAWSAPKRSWPISTAIGAAGVLIVLCLITSFYVSSASDLNHSVGDYFGARPTLVNSNNREAKTEKQRPIATVSPTPAASAHDLNHPAEKQTRIFKRLGVRPSDPPAPAIGPALRLPTQ